MGGFLIKRYAIEVRGYGTGYFEAASRGKAMAEAWRSPAFNGMLFKDFLKVARCAWQKDLPERFGDPITVLGKPAFFIENNRQYVRFVYPGETSVFNAHPYDVEPAEYRPDTYREPHP